MLTAHGLNETCPYAYPTEIDEVRWRTLSLRRDISRATVVMIGCGPAVFGLAIMENRQRAPQLWIVDIDPNIFAYAEAHFDGADIFPGIRDQIHFVEGDSAKVGKEWESEIDFLVVDGDHTYEGVKADIEAWLPHVKRGNLVFFHDYVERPGGFDGTGDWFVGGCARAVCEAIVDGRLMVVKRLGISMVCEKL